MAVDLTIEGFRDPVEAGWGGFAIVYRAQQATCHREVAIKVLNFRPGSDLAQEFQRECAAIGSLSGHPNIVAVHGLGETADGRPYIVMEYLHGGSLGDVVRARGPLPWKEAAEIGVALAGALETAHRAGLLHRDVKPENVLMSRFGRPKLGDFGIARLHGAGSGGSGVVVGSPRHLAPEVLEGHPPTVASDLYSFGSTLFTVLTGRPPVDAPERRLDGVPDPIARIVERAIAHDPAARPASAEEMGRQLQAALAGHGSAVPELAIDLRTGPRPALRRWPVRAGVAVAGLALVVASAALMARNPSSDEGEVAAAPSVSHPASSTTISTTTTTTPPAQPGSFTDDFSGSARLWGRSRSPEFVVSELVDGQYRTAAVVPSGVMGGLMSFVAPIPATPSHLVRIEVDGTKVSSERGEFGVSCGNADSQFPYSATVDTGGGWRIVRNEVGNFPDVRRGRDATALSGPGPYRIALECRGKGELVSMTLSVDGVELATATGAGGTAFGPGPGVVIYPLGAPIDVRFDNVKVEYS